MIAGRENKTQHLKVNLGCGSCTPQSWINVDYALGARLARIPFFRFVNNKLHLFKVDWNPRILIHDLRHQFPFKENSIDIVYTSHTLEHFTKVEGLRFLKECHRVLKPNGILRVVVPAMEVFVDKYTSGEIRADEFVEQLGVLTDNPQAGLLKQIAGTFIAFPHKCMYDTKTLLELLRSIGFRAEKRNAFDSDIDDIEEIEIEDRTKEAVILEGRNIKL